MTAAYAGFFTRLQANRATFGNARNRAFPQLPKQRRGFSKRQARRSSGFDTTILDLARQHQDGWWKLFEFKPLEAEQVQGPKPKTGIVTLRPPRPARFNQISVVMASA